MGASDGRYDFKDGTGYIEVHKQSLTRQLIRLRRWRTKKRGDSPAKRSSTLVCAGWLRTSYSSPTLRTEPQTLGAFVLPKRNGSRTDHDDIDGSRNRLYACKRKHTPSSLRENRLAIGCHIGMPLSQLRSRRRGPGSQGDTWVVDATFTREPFSLRRERAASRKNSSSMFRSSLRPGIHKRQGQASGKQTVAVARTSIPERPVWPNYVRSLSVR